MAREITQSISDDEIWRQIRHEGHEILMLQAIRIGGKYRLVLDKKIESHEQKVKLLIDLLDVTQ